MKRVPVDEFAREIRRYLREVENGDVLLLTENGEAVAELRPPTLKKPVLSTGLPQNQSAYPLSLLRGLARSADLLDAEREES